ncbi:MAG: phospholipid/cholesterol/gamma-HCH transport system substrate-binding protein [Myxococcota bacterium]
MAPSRKYELGVGLLLVGAAAVLGVMALQLGALTGFGESVDVETRFTDVGGLQSGASVAVAGVQIGTVTSLDIDFDRAVVGMSIDPEAGIRQDATAQVRARSVLGEKYVEIVPHSREAGILQDGDTLQAGPEQTEIDELVSSMGPLVEAIDPVVFQRVLGSLASALEDDPERLSRMLANADTLLANGAQASLELPALMSEGRATLGSLRGTLGRADRAVAKLDALLVDADAVLADVGAATDTLPALADEATMTLREARALVAGFETTKSAVDEVLAGFEGFDKWEIRRLLREEGILVRLRSREVIEQDNTPYRRRGSTR